MVLKFIEKAWKAYKKNFWEIIGATVLVFAITFLIMAVFFIPSGMNIGQMGMMQTTTTMPMASPVFLLGNWVLVLVGTIITAVVGVLLGAGLIRLYYEALRNTKKVKIETVFKTAKDKFWTILGAKALVAAIVFGFIIALMVPGIFLSMVSSMALLGLILSVAGTIVVGLIALLFVLVDQSVVIGNKRAVKAVEESINVVKKNYLSVLAISLFFLVLNVIINVPLGILNLSLIGNLIGILVIWPLAGLALTSLYVSRRKKK